MSRPVRAAPVEVVLWDFGGVFTGSPFHRLDAYARELGTTGATLVDLILGYDQPDGDHPWHRLERGELALTDAIAAGERAASDAGIEGFDLRGFFEAMSSGPEGRDAMFDGVRRLQARGVRHAIVSNNISEFRDRWQAMLPAGLFELVIDSSQEGLRKPDPRLFVLALDRMGTDPSRAVFLDDHPANVTAARDLGISAILVGPDPLVALAELDAHVSARADPV